MKSDKLISVLSDFLIFSKNLSSKICSKVDSGYPRGTCESVVHIPLSWNNGNNYNFVFETCEFNIF